MKLIAVLSFASILLGLATWAVIYEHYIFVGILCFMVLCIDVDYEDKNGAD